MSLDCPGTECFVSEPTLARDADRWRSLTEDLLDALEAALCGEAHYGHRYCPEALLFAVRLMCLWKELR